MTPRPPPITSSRRRAAIAVVALLAIGGYVGLEIGQSVAPRSGVSGSPTPVAAERSQGASGSGGPSSLPRSTSTIPPGRSTPPGSPGVGTPPPGGLPAFQDLPVIPGFGPTGRTEPARIVRIVDGDTVHVLVGGADRALRYIGMDTPESVKPGSPVEPFAKAATEANRQLVDGHDVVLEWDVSETDRFKRLLRVVWIQRPEGWLQVDLELVRLGFARVTTFPPDVKYVELYTAAQQVAQAAGRGRWAATP
jgi:micrococcal nuclease